MIERRLRARRPRRRAAPWRSRKPRARRDARRRADRRHDRHLVARAVEHHHDGRADQQRLGHADRIGLGRRQALHAPHHVVAEIAENARRHRRQAGRHVDARFGEQRSQRLERIAGAGDEGVRIDERPAVDLGALAGRAEDEVGIEADHRIAAALRAALDRFEQEHVARAAARQLEIGRDRRLEVGDQRRDRDLGFAGRIGARERFVIGQGGHRFSRPRRIGGRPGGRRRRACGAARRHIGRAGSSRVAVSSSDAIALTRASAKSTGGVGRR